MDATLLTIEGESVVVRGTAAGIIDAERKIEENLTSVPGQTGWRKKLVGATVVEITVRDDVKRDNILGRSF